MLNWLNRSASSRRQTAAKWHNRDVGQIAEVLEGRAYLSAMMGSVQNSAAAAEASATVIQAPEILERRLGRENLPCISPGIYLQGPSSPTGLTVRQDGTGTFYIPSLGAFNVKIKCKGAEDVILTPKTKDKPKLKGHITMTEVGGEYSTKVELKQGDRKIEGDITLRRST